MGNLKYLMIHCTATKEGKDITTVDVRRMHTLPEPEGRGWKQVGYSDLIRLSGAVDNMVPYDQDDQVQLREISNGSAGMNSETRHVAYAGGVDIFGAPKDTRTMAQIEAMKKYVIDFLKLHPKAKVLGHNQVANKACPSFNVPKWLAAIGINKSNIY